MRLAKDCAAPAQTTVPKKPKVQMRNTGRRPIDIPSGTQKKFYPSVHSRKHHTPNPSVRIHQLTVPRVVSVKSVWNSFVRRSIAGPIPTITHPVMRTKKLIAMKAEIFLHAGQLRGSLGSLEGCGTSTISESFFVRKFNRWEATSTLSPKSEYHREGEQCQWLNPTDPKNEK